MIKLTEDNLNRTIINLAWPIIVQSLIRSSVFIFDNILVGPLGTEAIAAVGQGVMILTTITFFHGAIGTATTAIVARNLGRNDMEVASRVAGQGLILGGAFGIVLRKL